MSHAGPYQTVMRWVPRMLPGGELPSGGHGYYERLRDEMLTIKAEDPKQGMTCDELIAAISRAAGCGFYGLGRVDTGFKGQVKSVTFTEGRRGGDGKPKSTVA